MIVPPKPKDFFTPHLKKIADFVVFPEPAHR